MKLKTIFCLSTFCMFAFSCSKWLDAKPDKKLVVPSTVEDLQALLDQNTIMNFSSPSLGEASATDFWMKESDLASLSPQDNAVYAWNNDIYYGGFPNDWSNAFNPIYFANLALEPIDKFARTAQNDLAWKNVKGSALLFRAKSLLDAAWIWCNAYDKQSSQTDIGLPLRLSSDFNDKSVRSNLATTYNVIISDLNEAALLLPDVPLHVMRPLATWHVLIFQ